MNSTILTQMTVSQVVSAPHVLADDARGIIEKLDQGGESSVLRITSKKGTVRANHYHQHDSHVCYVIRGRIRYVEKPVLPDGTVDASAPLVEYIVEAGQCFTTVPMVAHAMEFLEDTEFLAISPRSGNQAEYENDIIRVTLIDPAEAVARAAT